MLVSDFFGLGALVRAREYPLVSLLRGHSLGRIVVASGELRVGDAYSLEEVRPIEVPAGSHEVIFAANEMDAGHDGAGLVIRVRPGKVARWRKLRTVGIDGATLAIADARTRIPNEKLTSFESRLDAGRIGRSAVIARIGSDGGYALRGGFDVRERLTQLAVVTRDPRSLVPWPARGSDVARVDPTDLDACLAWARRIGGDDAILRAGETDLAPLRAIRSIPADLRRYYATHTPWISGDIGTFRTIVERHSLGKALPIAVNGDDDLVYCAEDGTIIGLYEGSTMSSCLDLRAWALLSTIAVHDLGTR